MRVRMHEDDGPAAVELVHEFIETLRRQSKETIQD